jgi:hypothetical protein
MAKDNIIGLAFRGDCVEWATLAPVREEFRTTATGSVPVEGELDEGQIKALAGGLLTEAGGLNGHVVMGLPSEDMLLRVVTLPLVESDELRSMVRLQADKFSPFPVESMVVSHEVLEKRGDSCVVLIVAARAEVVGGFGRVMESAGVQPERVDVSLMGRWHALDKAGEIRAEGRQLLLLLEGGIAEIVVAQNGTPILMRSLGTVQNLAEQELAAELAGEVGYTLMSLELEHGSAGECVVNVWHDGAVPAGLEEKMHQECGSRPVLSSLESMPSRAEGVAQRSAEKGAGRLDLTPDVWRSAAGTKDFKRKMVKAAVIIFGVWIVGAGALFGGLRFQEMRLASLKAERDELREPAMEIRRLRARVLATKRHGDMSESSLECLREISAVQPVGVDLTSFTYRKGEGVKISGEALTTELVYDFKRKLLEESQLFSGIDLQGPHEIPKRNRQRFDMDIKLRGGEQ